MWSWSRAPSLESLKAMQEMSVKSLPMLSDLRSEFRVSWLQ